MCAGLVETPFWSKNTSTVNMRELQRWKSGKKQGVMDE